MVVIGLGLVGQLASQIIQAAGCSVIGLDLDGERADLARRLGADRALVTGGEDSIESVRECVEGLTGGLGADAVLVCAATSESGPVRQAGELCRDRGTVVVVGAVGMDVPRDLYYQKELTLRVARSYGPGRYDSTYEEKGIDYPAGYVRWTENRNMGAFLELLREGQIQVGPLVTHRFSISEADRAYDLITESEGCPSPLGLIIEYPPINQSDENGRDETKKPGKGEPASHSRAETAAIQGSKNPTRPDDLPVGVLGAGSFATGTLIPAMINDPATRLTKICSATGPSAEHAAQKFDFDRRTTEEEALVSDPEVGAVVIATPHNLHARQVVSAIEAGKHVYCEKPLCLTQRELLRVISTVLTIEDESDGDGPVLTVGYNRRFAPMALKLREFFWAGEEPVAPLLVQYRVNAGRIPLDSWIQDPEVGGGRVIGEVCHFVDFLTFLTGALPKRVSAAGIPDRGIYREDNVAVTVEMSDGSVGVVTYIAAGDRSLGKERCEVFGGGASAVLDDFKRLELIREGRTERERSWLGQDKGHEASWASFSRAARRGGSPPIPLKALAATSLATFRIQESLRSSEPRWIRTREFIDRVAKGGNASQSDGGNP
jgi:predicted dehydrogenase